MQVAMHTNNSIYLIDLTIHTRAVGYSMGLQVRKRYQFLGDAKRSNPSV